MYTYIYIYIRVTYDCELSNVRNRHSGCAAIRTAL